MMLTTAQAIARILTRQQPLLCLDACAVLDVVRDPTRERFGVAHAKASVELVALAEERLPRLSLLLSQQARDETGAHLASVEQESRRSLELLDERMGKTHGILAAMGTTIVQPPKLSGQG